MMNEYIIELLQYSYITGIGGIYVLYNKKDKKVIEEHFSTDDAWALNDLLPKISDENFKYELRGVKYYGL